MLPPLIAMAASLMSTPLARGVARKIAHVTYSYMEREIVSLCQTVPSRQLEMITACAPLLPILNRSCRHHHTRRDFEAVRGRRGHLQAGLARALGIFHRMPTSTTFLKFGIHKPVDYLSLGPAPLRGDHGAPVAQLPRSAQGLRCSQTC